MSFILTAIKIRLFKWITNGCEYTFSNDYMLITLRDGPTLFFSYDETSDCYTFERFGRKD